MDLCATGATALPDLSETLKGREKDTLNFLCNTMPNCSVIATVDPP